MVDRVFRLEPVGVRQEPRRAARGRKTSSVTAASLYEGPPTEPRLSPRPIFLAAAKLVQIWSSNEQALSELQELRQKIEKTRAYLASPGCHRHLAEAYLKRLQKTEKENLAALRDNRRSAWELMAGLNVELGSQPGPDSLQTSSGPAVEFSDGDCRSHSRHCWYA